MPLGLYVHVPFCLSKCPYCDFYSVTFDEKLADNYCDAVLRNIPSKLFDTIYFGGGTPTLLGKRLGDILNKINRTMNCEITVEANPNTVDEELLFYLRRCGVNRISFGVQSFCDDELKSLGRIHGSEQAVNAILMANKCGFNNISADLMLAVPNQTLESLKLSIDVLTGLPINHISAYILKIENDTPFYKSGIELADDEIVREFYLYTVNYLREKGFIQYEISNFAKKERKCLHNLKYWYCKQYLGVGPAAHSFYDNKRFAVTNDINKFISDQLQEIYYTDEDAGNIEELLLLRLRLNEGISFDECKTLGIKIDDLLKKCSNIPQEYIEITKNNINLTPEGFLLSNQIISKLLF